MKIIKFILPLAVLYLMSVSCFAQADSNRVTRNTLVNAIRKIQSDSVKIDTSLVPPAEYRISDTLKCDVKTTSLVIYVSNSSLPDDKPYSLTYTKDGIILEVFSEGMVVYRGTFGYGKTSYKKLLSRINLQQLICVCPYGDEVVGSGSITFSTYRGSKCFFTAYDNDGILNVKGNFHPLVTYMKGLVPDLNKIIEDCETASDDNDKTIKDPTGNKNAKR